MADKKSRHGHRAVRLTERAVRRLESVELLQRAERPLHPLRDGVEADRGAPVPLHLRRQVQVGAEDVRVGDDLGVHPLRLERRRGAARCEPPGQVQQDELVDKRRAVNRLHFVPQKCGKLSDAIVPDVLRRAEVGLLPGDPWGAASDFCRGHGVSALRSGCQQSAQERRPGRTAPATTSAKIPW